MDGILYYENMAFNDLRGNFAKLYQNGRETPGLEFHLQEIFISKSKKDVIRGFHLQMGSSANHRLISVVNGSVLDVLLDLRPESPTFMRFHSREMNAANPHILIVPPGVAHAFLALEECQMVYVSDKVFDPELDAGVNPLQCGYDWPVVEPIISARDLQLPTSQEWQDTH